MGLITGLVTLPLAPVRATMWIAERVREQAELEAGDEDAVRRRLLELEMRHDMGELDDAEFARQEDELLAQLARSRSASSGQSEQEVGGGSGGD